MATWKQIARNVETTLMIETQGESTSVTMFSLSFETGKDSRGITINIPLETLKEMVNAQ